MLYLLLSKDGKVFDTTKECLKPIDEKDTSTIPIIVDDYCNESKQLTDADLQKLDNSKALASDQV